MTATLTRRLRAAARVFTQQRGPAFAAAFGVAEWRYPQHGGRLSLWLAFNDQPTPVWWQVPAGREAEVHPDLTVAQARALVGA